MIRNLEGFRVSAHYCNQYFVCGDVVDSYVVDENPVYLVYLVKPLNTGEVVLDSLFLKDSEIIEAWVPDALELVMPSDERVDEIIRKHEL